MKDRLFLNQSKPYDSDNYERILKEHFGAERKMKDITGIKVVVIATHGTVQKLKMKLFTNFDETAEEEVWKVARRTSAAPTYFGPMEEKDSNDNILRFYDGGLVGNNSTRAILIRHSNLVKNGVIVSLGTGKPILENKPLPDIGDNKIALWWSGDLESFATAFINHITRTDGDVVDDDMRLCKEFNCSYYRFTPTLTDVIELDETDELRIVKMMWTTQAFIQNNVNSIRSCLEAITQSSQGSWNCSVQ